ncbi:hypothetical protein LEP1GSC127_0005, partial [Leptospira kirschneri str. 200801925]
LIRWERKSENYLASLYLAISIIAFNFLIGSFETGSKVDLLFDQLVLDTRRRGERTYKSYFFRTIDLQNPRNN